MKTASIFAVSLFLSLAARAQTIQDLPILSTTIIHHYDCRAAILPGTGAPKELMFQMLPNGGGHTGSDYTVVSGTDKVVASVNSQMLQIVWTRGSQTVAAAQTMIQLSPTLAYILIVTDPLDDSNQVDLGCNAVTFADLKRGLK